MVSRPWLYAGSRCNLTLYSPAWQQITTYVQYGDLSALPDKFDVFVSYQRRDLEYALELVRVLLFNGAIVYLDILDVSTPEGDDVNVVEYLSNVIKRSRCLAVVLSANTKNSWWVPLEWGMAYLAEKERFCYEVSPSVPAPAYIKRSTTGTIKELTERGWSEWRR